MKRDVMEGSGLEIFAEIGLILFLIAFLLVLVRVFLLKGEKAQEYAEIPLEDSELQEDS